MEFGVGDIIEGTVTGITKFGAFVALPGEKKGLVHISEVSHDFIKDISTVLQEKDIIRVKILKMDEDGKISLSIKKAIPQRPQRVREERGNSRVAMGFEDMMKKFMQDSNERQGEVKRHNEGKKGSR